MRGAMTESHFARPRPHASGRPRTSLDAPLPRAGLQGISPEFPRNPWPRSGVWLIDIGVKLMSKAQLAKLLLILLVLGAGGPALAATFEDMLGTWRWQDFTIEVRACGEVAFACAKVVAGPKNVGMDVFAS